MLRRVRGFLMLSVLSACSPVTVLNALAPRAGIAETRDVRYAPGDRHELDIYAPEAGRPAPVVVFIYGGGWKDGSKGEYRFVAAALAARGFLTVVPDYRLYPQVRFPAFLQDNAAAVAWTRAHIAGYGGDPGRIFLMGHSAGAYNVAMLTLDKQWLGADGLDPDHDIAGTIGLAGPYDFLPLHDPELEDIFAPAGDLRLSQPITFARGNAPPMFLAAGSADQTVWPRNTEHLAEAIRADGGRVEARIYPGVNHVKIIGAMAGILRWLAPSMADVTGFLDRHRPSAGPLSGKPPQSVMARTRPSGVMAGRAGTQAGASPFGVMAGLGPATHDFSPQPPGICVDRSAGGPSNAPAQPLLSWPSVPLVSWPDRPTVSSPALAQQPTTSSRQAPQDAGNRLRVADGHDTNVIATDATP